MNAFEILKILLTYAIITGLDYANSQIELNHCNIVSDRV